MDIFQFRWIEMSGGFEQEANILASNIERAKEIFSEKIFKWNEYIKVENLNKKFTIDYLKKQNNHIHFKENE